MIRAQLLKIINDMDWNQPLEIQLEAIQRAKELPNEELLILVQREAGIPKGSWENIARVINEVGYLQNEIYLERIFEWLQDLNWPGVDIIVETICVVKFENYSQYLIAAVNKAVKENDECWLMGLSHLLKTLENEDYSKANLQEIYVIQNKVNRSLINILGVGK